MLHGQKHRYVLYLCKKHDCSLEELYHSHRDELTRNVKIELFLMLKDKKKQEMKP